MVLESLRLEAINRTLLSSGVYAPQDARQVAGFLYGNSKIALAEICRVALKYVDANRTLNAMKQDLEDSYKFYSSKGRQQYLENNVSAEVTMLGDVVSSITIVCNPDYLKSLPYINCEHRTESLITFSPSELSTVLTHLDNCGLKLKDLKDYLKTKGVKASNLKKTTNSLDYTDGKVALEKVSNRTVKVICSKTLQAVVREIKGFRVAKDSHLEVPISSLMTLYTKLSAVARKSGEDLDLTDFETYIDTTIHEGDFTPTVKLQGLTVVMQIEYHPFINETMLNIPTVQFIEQINSWAFHRRHLTTVIERLSMTNLNVDVSNLQQLNDAIEFEYDATGVQLYDFARTPWMITPWNHQVTGAERILEERKILLADEMGSGKTYTTILAAFSVGLTLGLPLVIVCPSALKLNWVKEIRKIDKQSPICVVEGNDIFKAPWIIINYDILDRHSRTLLEWKPKFIAFDESHKIKSITEQGFPGSVRAQHSIVLSTVVPYVVSMTGTPMPKGPIDLFNQFKLIDHPLSDDFIAFGTTYCDGHPSKNGWDFSGSSNESELHEILKTCMIRNRKEDCLDLPDKLQTFMPVSVDLTHYRQAVDEYMNTKEIHPRAYQMVLVGQMKKHLAYAKVPRTIEIIQQVLENGDSIVVFSDYTAVIEVIRDFVNKNYSGKMFREVPDGNGSVQQIPIHEVAVTVTGKDSSTRKFEKSEAFQEGFHKVLIANMKAGGVGLNMTAANKLCFNDLTWLPDDHFQAEDRIHRGGQTKKVEIIYVIAQGAEIDEKLGNVIEERSKVSAAIIDGGSHKGRQASVMAGVLRYVEEVQTGKRKAGNFVVDELEVEDFLSELDLDSAEFNDDNGEFEFDLELEDGSTELGESRQLNSTSQQSKVPSKPKYPCIENGVYVNPPYNLSIISREPLVYQYVKVFEGNGYTLALQMRFDNGQLAFKVLKRDDYTHAIQDMQYTKATQVNGAFGANGGVDEVGTHILQHLTKINNYMDKGNLQYAKGTIMALLNGLKRYLD